MDDDDDDDGGGEGAPAWMATFSDLATLLLTFFVLLLSFAELNVTEFKEMLGSVRDAFGVQFESQGHFEALSISPISMSDMGSGPQVQEEMVREIEELIEEEELEEDVEIELNQGGVTVRVRDRLLFGSGSANIEHLESAEVLTKIASLGEVFRGDISIEGHTDNRPIRTARFPSNWELSAARATSVLRFLVQETELSRDRMRIAGYADTRPLGPNNSNEGRGRNRRVEFRFSRRATPASPVVDDPIAALEAAEGQGADGAPEEERSSLYQAITGPRTPPPPE